MTRSMWIVLVLPTLTGFFQGCAGAPAARTGAAKGCVIVGPSGPEVRCCVEVLPPGYSFASDATVRIVGLSGAEDITDWRGRYYIGGIPPGIWTLEVLVDGWPPLRIDIQIIAGRVTWGTGHSEGGGG